MVPLLFLSFLGAVSYKGYQLLLPGRLTLRELKEIWSDAREMRAKALQYIKIPFTKCGLYVMTSVYNRLVNIR